MGESKAIMWFFCLRGCLLFWGSSSFVNCGFGIWVGVFVVLLFFVL